MLVRQIVVPTTPEQLWDALTAPDQIEAWFGSRVEWDLRPGGQARFLDRDGTVRGGVIDAVQPGRHLRFRWWREDQGRPGHPSNDSQVSYDLEAEEDGTRLTVREQPVPATRRRGTSGAAPATEASTGSAPACAIVGSWTAWDSRLFRCWAALAGPVAEVSLLAPAGRAFVRVGG